MAPAQLPQLVEQAVLGLVQFVLQTVQIDHGIPNSYVICSTLAVSPATRSWKP